MNFQVYETCRCHYQVLHLSPFLFEDFCAALSSEGQTNLLAEIHIALLKAALKDDEEEQVILSVQDTNNSFNIMLQVLDPMTYAEVEFESWCALLYGLKLIVTNHLNYEIWLSFDPLSGK